MTCEIKHFDRLCALLPHGALWGDILTPAIVQGICEAIAAQPQAEPVAWINHYACMPPRIDSAATAGARRSEPLFAQPPAPRAAPLTDAQIVECAEESNIRTDLWRMGAGSLVYSDDCNGIPRSDFTNFVRAIERAHGIKGDSNA